MGVFAHSTCRRCGSCAVTSFLGRIWTADESKGDIRYTDAHGYLKNKLTRARRKRTRRRKRQRFSTVSLLLISRPHICCEQARSKLHLSRYHSSRFQKSKISSVCSEPIGLTPTKIWSTLDSSCASARIHWFAKWSSPHPRINVIPPQPGYLWFFWDAIARTVRSLRKPRAK